jgi:putative ABC transport system permease protein
MAKQFWPNEDPMGKPLTVHRSSQLRPDFGQPINGVVLGVVRDMHQFSRERDTSPEIYVPYTQEVWPWITLVVRASNPDRVIPALRQAVLDVDAAIPVRNGGAGLFGGFKTVSSLVSSTMAQRRFALAMVGTFAVCALLLAAIGMYGVISYGVAQRTREVGVRMALGATQRSIMRLILGEGLRLALIGAAVGLAGAFAGTRLIRAMLFATGATDPATFVLMPLLLGGVAVIACYLPARRATRLDPTLAIRGE